MLWEALGSFDVNTVCSLPGSWINHVPFIVAHSCHQSHVFPGQGVGPRFSFSCRHSALDHTLNLNPRRVFPGKGAGTGFSLCCRPSALNRALIE